MTPEEIVRLADRLANIEPDIGARDRLSIRVSQSEWNSTLAFVQQFEPITSWPAPQRGPVTRLVVRGIPILVGEAS